MKVRVITPDEMHERTARFRETGLCRDDFERAELERGGPPLFVWWPEKDGRETFSWLCPGCGGWRRGTCPGGHYWLRDGELVPA